jgi:hypothetical protein
LTRRGSATRASLDDDDLTQGIARHAAQCVVAAIFEDEGDRVSEILATLFYRAALAVGAGTSGQYAMNHSPSRSMIAVNSLCIAGLRIRRIAESRDPT